jgi:hypothetical protein
MLMAGRRTRIDGNEFRGNEEEQDTILTHLSKPRGYECVISICSVRGQTRRRKRERLSKLFSQSYRLYHVHQLSDFSMSKESVYTYLTHLTVNVSQYISQ